jgi:uncharacterized repeat protein (TIGR02543 family)
MTTLGCFVLAAAAIGFTACTEGTTSTSVGGNTATSNTGATESNATATYTVTFSYNYDDAPVASTASVNAGEKATKPTSDPTRDMYIFTDWYTDAACTTKYDFDAAVTADMTLYAGWKEDDAMAGKKIWVFEAECVDFSDFNGAGYSGGATGTGAILTDWDGSGKASDGLFVSFLYVQGDDTKLTFVINSDKEVDDATLILRLSGEVLETVTFSAMDWEVIVNDTPIPYPEISISGCRTNMSEEWVREFQDFTITTTLHLNAGENTIVLYTNNETPMAGTMFSTAPMVDCMKIITSDDVTLSWDPITNKAPYYGK